MSVLERFGGGLDGELCRQNRKKETSLNLFHGHLGNQRKKEKFGIFFCFSFQMKKIAESCASIEPSRERTSSACYSTLVFGLSLNELAVT